MLSCGSEARSLAQGSLDLNQGCQSCVPLEEHLFSCSFSYKQNSVLCICRTEVSISFLVISWELFQYSRCCKHSIALGPFLHLQSFNGGLGLSHVLDFLPFLHHIFLTDFCVCLFLLTYKDLLLKAHIILPLSWVIWILEFNLPILRSVTLILSGMILLSCNIIYLQVPGIRAWTSLRRSYHQGILP